MNEFDNVNNDIETQAEEAAKETEEKQIPAQEVVYEASTETTQQEEPVNTAEETIKETESSNEGEYHFVKPDAGSSFDSGYTSSYTAYNAESEEKKSSSTYTYYNSPYTSSPKTYSHEFTNNDSEKEKKTKKTKRERKGNVSFLTVALCCILSLACGFGGAWAYSKFLAPSSSQTVIYQAVDGDSSSSVTTTAYSLADIVERCKPSVVEINTEILTSNGFFGTQTSTAAGSGVIFSTDGFIITNYHVVEDANTISVTSAMGKTYSAVLYGYDEENDLAIIKISTTDELTPAVIADSSSLRVGDSVFAIGNPLGTLGGSVTEGIISALDREIEVEDQTMTLLQISAAVNPGNSGGGLFNTNGELVGIVNAKSTGDDVEGIGFAIPSSIVMEAATTIIENGGSVSTETGPILGITIVDIQSNETAQQYRVSRLGVYVVGVSDGYGAQAAGLEVGDYLVSVDDIAIAESSDLKGYLKECKAGDYVTIQIIRDNRMMSFKVELMDSAKG